MILLYRRTGWNVEERIEAPALSWHVLRLNISEVPQEAFCGSDFTVNVACLV